MKNPVGKKMIHVVLLTALAGCGNSSDVISRTGDFESSVPDDRVQPLGFSITDYPTFEDLTSLFRKCHAESEKIYNGDGSWGKGYGDRFDPPVYHPLVRDTARRVLGYIDAYHSTGEAIYKQRAREGLEYLLKVQRTDGQFIWWYGDPKKGTVGGGSSLYVTGIPAAALIEGYKFFKDKKYLAAANKACDYICTVPDERGSHPRVFSVTNANYNLFASWALAVNYEVTGNEYYLDRAQRFAWSAIYKQLPSGMWSDEHNQKICYHGIIMRGLATLLSVMPENDAHRAQIQKATFKALNHFIRRQQPDGKTLTMASGRNAAWDAFSSQSIAIISMRLNWPVSDSLHLAAKGATASSYHIMTVGSLMRAYKQAER
ncbi:MAG: glycoside hydrolase family 127 protein [Planctomycetota bacterium]|nr:glycoside hydrolase family 127 protein [Planctomycetota bacterium]